MAETYVCVVTRIRLRRLRLVPAFLMRSAGAVAAARSTPGHVRTRLLGMPPVLHFLTLTVWESEEAMRSFVRTPGHRRAMVEVDRFARDNQFVQFTSTTPRVGWRRAFRELRASASAYPESAAAG